MSAGRFGSWVALVALVAADATPARAQGSGAECRANPFLPRARDQYDRLDFDLAARTLQRAFEHPRNCRRDLAEMYRLRGFIDAVNAERERCQRAFELSLALDPAYEPSPDVPPKVRTCFEDAARVPPSRRRLELVHVPPAQVPPNAPLALAVRLDDPLRMVDQVQVWFRRAGLEVYTTVAARADDTVSVVVPALALPAAPSGYALQYFVRAVDRYEGTLSEQGDPLRPLELMVEPARSDGGVASQWWFWTAIGAAVVGGAAAVLIATQSGGDSIPLSLVDGGARP